MKKNGIIMTVVLTISVFAIGGIIFALNHFHTVCGAEDIPQELTQVQQSFDQILEEDYFVAAQPDTTGGQISKAIYEKTIYRVVSADDTNCKIEITYPNMRKEFEELSSQLYSQQFDDTNDNNQATSNLLNNMLLQLEQEDYEMVTEIITTRLVNGTPEINDDILNAFYGGMLYMYTDMLDDYVQKHIK